MLVLDKKVYKQVVKRVDVYKQFKKRHDAYILKYRFINITIYIIPCLLVFAKES